jgi:hypothetical protein
MRDGEPSRRALVLELRGAAAARRGNAAVPDPDHTAAPDNTAPAEHNADDPDHTATAYEPGRTALAIDDVRADRNAAHFTSTVGTPRADADAAGRVAVVSSGLKG